MCCAVLSHSVMSNSCDFMDCGLPGTSGHGDSPGKNTGVGCHALLPRIFPTQGLNPDLLHCRPILYHLSYQGSTRILEWIAYHFSRGSSQYSQYRDGARVSCTVGRVFTIWATHTLKQARTHNGERTVFSINAIGKSGQIHAKRWSWTTIRSYTKKFKMY